MSSSKRLALIGAGAPESSEMVKDIWKKNGQAMDAWSFRIRDAALPILMEQLQRDGGFHIYYYHSKTKGGNGLVNYQSKVKQIWTGKSERASPDVSITPSEWATGYRTYLLVDNVLRLEKPIDLAQFRDFSDNSTKIPSALINSFAYVVDLDPAKLPTREDLISQLPEGISTEIVMDESDLEEMVATDPALLGLGELELLDRQKTMEAGRLDLLFKRKEDDRLILVELKKAVLKDRDIIQLKSYMSASQFTGKSVKGLLICGDLTDRQKRAIDLDKKHGYDIEIRKYTCELTLLPDE